MLNKESVGIQLSSARIDSSGRRAARRSGGR
jgi:hypothetical protein